MDNQHRKITGYRELSEDEIAAMNAVKEVGADIGALIYSLESNSEFADKRWLAIAKTDLQKGIMSLVRSVAKPETF